jgi:hypothetical protein
MFLLYLSHVCLLVPVLSDQKISLTYTNLDLRFRHLLAYKFYGSEYHDVDYLVIKQYTLKDTAVMSYHTT